MQLENYGQRLSSEDGGIPLLLEGRELPATISVWLERERMRQLEVTTRS